MYPRLFELPWSIPRFGPITVYTYGVLLAAAYLLGLQLAMVRARKRSLDATRVMDLGIYIIISALIGAKLLLLVTDFQTFRSNPAELLTPRAVGRRVLRRPDSGGRGRARSTSAASACRSGRRATCSRRGLRSGTSSAASAVSSPAAATASRRRCRGASRSPIRSRPPTSARRSTSAAPDAALRGRRRVPDPGAAPRHGAQGQAASRAGRSGSTCCCTPCRASSSSSSATIRAAWSACSRPRSSSRVILAPLAVDHARLSRRARRRRRPASARARRRREHARSPCPTDSTAPGSTSSSSRSSPASRDRTFSA